MRAARRPTRAVRRIASIRSRRARRGVERISVGSAFYLCYALAHGVDAALARDLVSAVVPCIAASVLLHGVSATPLMNWYQRRREGGGSA